MVLHNLRVEIGVAIQILADESESRIRVEELADVRNPLRVLADDRRRRGEFFGDRVERDDDFDFRVSLIYDG